MFYQLCSIPSCGITLQWEHQTWGVYGLFPPRSRTWNYTFCILLRLIVNGTVSAYGVSEYNLSCFLNLAKLIGWLLQDNWIWELNLWFVIENGNIKWLQIRPCQHISSNLFNVLFGEMGQLRIYSHVQPFQTWCYKRDFKSIWRAMAVPCSSWSSPQELFQVHFSLHVERPLRHWPELRSSIGSKTTVWGPRSFFSVF